MVFMEKYTDEELIQIIVDLAVELGRTPRMKDLLERGGGPYPSLYQRRFSSNGCFKQDGWNIALAKAGLGFNRKKPDQEGECEDCGVDGFGAKGHLIRWEGDKTVCMSCYQKRYYREKKKEWDGAK